MALRVFPQLCMRARKAGAKRLTFEAQLDEALVDEENGVGTERAWSCAASRPFGDFFGEQIMAVAYGRSGEEALRLLVDKLENRR